MLRVSLLVITLFLYVTSSGAKEIQVKTLHGSQDVMPTVPHLNVEIGNKTYVFGLENIDWYEATAVCANMSMQLLTLDRKEKDDEISQWLRDNPTYDSWKWLAARREINADDFYWTTTGEQVEYSNWGPQQPMPPPTLAMCADFSGHWGYWEDDNCDLFTLSYICEDIP